VASWLVFSSAHEPNQEKLLEHKSLAILPEGQHRSLPFLQGFAILRSRTSMYVLEEKGGCNVFVRPSFFVTNSEESR
jgi:hypothetical protein